MRINAINNQKFSGKVSVVGSRQRKTLTNIAHDLNKMKMVREAKCNIYLAYGQEFFTNNNVVKVYAKSGGFNFKNDAAKMYDDAKNTVLSFEAIKSAVEREINSYTKRGQIN